MIISRGQWWQEKNLPPLSAADYHRVFAEIADRIPAQLRGALEHPDDHKILEAVENQKGFRFFEELLAAAVRKLRRTNHPPAPGVVLLLDRRSADDVQAA